MYQEGEAGSPPLVRVGERAAIDAYPMIHPCSTPLFLLSDKRQPRPDLLPVLDVLVTEKLDQRPLFRADPSRKEQPKRCAKPYQPELVAQHDLSTQRPIRKPNVTRMSRPRIHALLDQPMILSLLKRQDVREVVARMDHCQTPQELASNDQAQSNIRPCTWHLCRWVEIRRERVFDQRNRMCNVVVDSVVEQEAVGEETRRIVACGDHEFQHVEDYPAQEIDVELRVLVPLGCGICLQPRGRIEGERVVQERKRAWETQSEQNSEREDRVADL